MRRLLFCFSVLLLLLTACGRADNRIVSRHSQLTVTDGILTDQHGEPFQLRGLSTHGITWFPEYISEETFASLKAYGANVIRIAMYTDIPGGYSEDPAYSLSLVTQAIEYAKKQDMYVLVDWHILDDGDPTEHMEAAVGFFDTLAGLYPEDPAVLYEICNEPNGVEWKTIREYADAVIPVIRAHSPEAIVVFGTPLYSTDLRYALLEPYSGENILYAFHYYAGQHDNYDILQLAVEKGVPVMVSEWGINIDSNGEPAIADGEEFVSYLNEHGVSWCAWSLCNKDEVFSVLQPECTALSDWKETDFTEVGYTIFSALCGSKK